MLVVAVAARPGPPPPTYTQNPAYRFSSPNLTIWGQPPVPSLPAPTWNPPFLLFLFVPCRRRSASLTRSLCRVVAHPPPCPWVFCRRRPRVPLSLYSLCLSCSAFGFLAIVLCTCCRSAAAALLLLPPTNSSARLPLRPACSWAVTRTPAHPCSGPPSRRSSGPSPSRTVLPRRHPSIGLDTHRLPSTVPADADRCNPSSNTATHLALSGHRLLIGSTPPGARHAPTTFWIAHHDGVGL